MNVQADQKVDFLRDGWYAIGCFAERRGAVVSSEARRGWFSTLRTPHYSLIAAWRKRELQRTLRVARRHEHTDRRRDRFDPS
jgi:hypothetical protein